MTSMKKMEDASPTDRFIFHLSLNGRSENTMRAYRADIDKFYEWLAADRPVEHDEMKVAIPTYLNEIRLAFKPATVKRKASALRSFGQWLLDDPTYLSNYRSPKVAPGQPHPLPGGMDDVRRMADATKRPHHKALIGLCGMLGLRVSEALSVTAESFSEAEGELLLTVRGKGDKTRQVPVTNGVFIVLTPAYIESFNNPCRRLVPLADRSARAFLTRVGVKVGVGRPIASHDFRHTFATAAYAKTKDIRAVQDLLGHASSDTTQVYTGISMATKRDAVDV